MVSVQRNTKRSRLYQGTTGSTGPLGSTGSITKFTGTSSVNFGFGGFITAGLPYTLIADNASPTAGQISFGISEGDYFEIYANIITATGEDVSTLFSSLVSPVTFTLQNESGSFFISFITTSITSPLGVPNTYNFDFGNQLITPPANGTPLILNFLNNIYGEDSFVTTAISNPNVIDESVITLRSLTSSNHESLDDFSIEGVSLVVGEITPSVGFSVYASALNGTWGIYNFKYIIIN